MARSFEPCLCGDPECRRCFPVSDEPAQPQSELSVVHLMTEPGERLCVLISIIDGDVALRQDSDCTPDDFALIEQFLPTLLAELRARQQGKTTGRAPLRFGRTMH